MHARSRFFPALTLCGALLVAGACQDNPVGGGGDETPPTVALTLPRAGTMVAGDSATVEAILTDRVGVTRAAYSLNGGPETPVQLTGGTEVLVTFRVGRLVAGSNTIRMYAYDAAGNRAQGDASVTRDLSAPAVRITAPVSGDSLGAYAVDVLFEVPNQAAMSRLTYSVDGKPEQPLAMFFGQLLLSDLEEGRHTVAVYAYDATGKRGDDEVAFTVGLPKLAYTVTPLGTLGGKNAAAAALNATGQVVGWSETAAGDTTAFLWEGGRMTALGRLRGRPFYPAAINARGDVVGSARWGICSQAVLWRAGTLTELLSDGSDCPSSSAVDINDTGDVAANRTSSGGPVLLRGGTAVGLTDHGSGPRATAINVRGQVAGSARVSYSYGVIWDGAQGSTFGVGRHSYPVDLNDQTVVVGQGGLFGERSYVWQNGTSTYLQVNAVNAVRAVNNRGEVVGSYAPSPNATGGKAGIFLWKAGRTSVVVAKESGWALSDAVGINDQGQIAAYGRNASTGAAGPVLLTPAP